MITEGRGTSGEQPGAEEASQARQEASEIPMKLLCDCLR